MSKDQSLTEQLADFGLTPVEADIYLHLIGKPAKSVLEISRELNLPRTSVYDNAVKLAEKGLVQRIVKHKSQELKAYPLSILQTHIDKEKNRIEKLQEQFTELEHKLAYTTPSPLATEVRYYHGQKGLQQMLWNTLRATDEVVGYTQFGLVNIVNERFTEKFGTERLERGIKSRLMTNPEFVDGWRLKLEPVASYRRQFQQCRVIPKERLYISGDTTIYNNVFATAFWEQGEVVGVEIENSEIVKTQRSMFDTLWEQGSPIAPLKNLRF